MAKTTKKSLLHGVRGKVGSVVVRQLNDETVVQNRPKKVTSWSDGQKKHRRSFSQATRYAARVTSTKAGASMYTRDIVNPKMHPYQRAVQDYLNAPEIHDVDLGAYCGSAGSKISIIASDDFQVGNVKVTILNEQKGVVECGPAEMTIGKWLYVTTHEHKSISGYQLLVEVRDLPGNVTQFETIL